MKRSLIRSAFSRLKSLYLAVSFLLMFAASAWASEPASAVNVNTADAKTIAEVMVGVGTKKAEAIVAYRDQQGGFKSLDELINVKGIGQNTLDKNRHLLTIQ